MTDSQSPKGELWSTDYKSGYKSQAQITSQVSLSLCRPCSLHSTQSLAGATLEVLDLGSKVRQIPQVLTAGGCQLTTLLATRWPGLS